MVCVCNNGNLRVILFALKIFWGSYLLGSVGFGLVFFTVAKRVVHSCEQVLTWPCVVPQEDFILIDLS
jgi:hypothetical protein